MKITLIGLGQSLRGDDAAGLEAVCQWQERYPDTAQKVQVELSEMPGLRLLDLLEGIDAAVLVDAVHTQTTPGTILRIGTEELASFTPDAASAHGWGVAETLHLGLSLYPDRLNIRFVLIGIVGQQFDLGAGISPEVQAGLAEAVEMVEMEIHNLLYNY